MVILFYWGKKEVNSKWHLSKWPKTHLFDYIMKKYNRIEKFNMRQKTRTEQRENIESNYYTANNYGLYKLKMCF